MENKLFDSINIKTIEKLAGIVSANELSEITIKVGDCDLTIKGKKPQSAPAVAPFAMGQAPSPDKPPFVKVGDTVKKGDVIMIIESMKLMNEVQSEFDGVVERILVTDGQAVEFDQPIMIIK